MSHPNQLVTPFGRHVHVTPDNLERLPQSTARQPMTIEPAFYEACFRAMLKMSGRTMIQLGVTSALRGEGRTSIAAAMAAIQAREYSRRTLLVEADFDSPSLASRLNLDAQPGLAEVLTGEADVASALRPIGDGVWVITAGQVDGRRSRLAAELIASDLISEVAERFDCRVVDLPPLLQSTSGPLLVEKFGPPLLVVRARSTPAAAVREAVAGLPAPPSIILNGVESALPGWLERILSGR